MERSRVLVFYGPGETMKVVTMPSMPFGPSAWVRMWQWNAQIPGVLFGPRNSAVGWMRTE